MPPRRTVLMNCQEAKNAGITWRRVNQQARDWSQIGSFQKVDGISRFFFGSSRKKAGKYKIHAS